MQSLDDQQHEGQTNSSLEVPSWIDEGVRLSSFDCCHINFAPMAHGEGGNEKRTLG